MQIDSAAPTRYIFGQSRPPLQHFHKSKQRLTSQSSLSRPTSIGIPFNLSDISINSIQDGTTTCPLLPLLQEQALPQVEVQPWCARPQGTYLTYSAGDDAISASITTTMLEQESLYAKEDHIKLIVGLRQAWHGITTIKLGRAHWSQLVGYRNIWDHSFAVQTLATHNCTADRHTREFD